MELHIEDLSTGYGEKAISQHLTFPIPSGQITSSGPMAAANPLF